MLNAQTHQQNIFKYDLVSYGKPCMRVAWQGPAAMCSCGHHIICAVGLYLHGRITLHSEAHSSDFSDAYCSPNDTQRLNAFLPRVKKTNLRK